SEPIPITQDRPASRSRNSTARINPPTSAQNDRTAELFSGPGFIVTIRKIAARVSGADTGCATTIVNLRPVYPNWPLREMNRCRGWRQFQANVNPGSKEDAE